MCWLINGGFFKIIWWMGDAKVETKLEVDL